MQGNPLDPQITNLADIEVVLAAAVDGVDEVELLRGPPGLAEFADHGGVELQLIDLAGDVDVVWRIGVRRVEHLVRPRRDAERLGRADTGDLRLEGAVTVEHLDALVAGVGNVDIALGIDRDRAGGGADLARFGALRAPRFDEHAVLVELRHALIADAVGHVDVSGGVEGDVGRATEEIGRGADAGRLTGRWRRNGEHAGFLSARWHRHGLGFAAHQDGNAAFAVVLDDHVRHLIDNPD